MWPVLAAMLAAASLAPMGVQAQELPVDLELVLAVDVSGSMDRGEQDLQRKGYVAAVAHPDVVAAIGDGAYGRIAVTYVEWAGSAAQSVAVPWRVVEDAGSARAFADELASAPISRARGTSISGGLAFSAQLFDGNGFEGLRRIIDVSGDGPNNMGAPIEQVRDAIVDDGIGINGLPILLRPSSGQWSVSQLDRYYEDCVIGGPGAFVISVTEPDQFTEAIRRKLVLEIAGLEPRLDLAGLAPRAERTDCLIGERLWRRWNSDP